MGKTRGNGDDVPGPTPSGLGRILKGAHDAKRTERAIADTAKGRRIKAQQGKDQPGRKGRPGGKGKS